MDSYTLMVFTTLNPPPPTGPGNMSCSGNLIGPNLMLTASHCATTGTPLMPNGIWSNVITYDDQKNPRLEKYWCQTLLTTWSDTDLALWFCDLPGGMPPGLKYGYGDFDFTITNSAPLGFQYGDSLSKILVGNSVHRFWFNGISGVPGSHNIYGTGSISSVTDPSWMDPSVNPSSPTCNAVVQQIGVATNVYSAPGSSGSSHWSSDVHRLLAGPLTVSSSPEGTYSAQLSAAYYMYWGWLIDDSPPAGCQSGYVNKNLIDNGFNLNHSDYYGWLDHDLDGVFDIQQDIELVNGEFPRSLYWLGFESNRRNVLWIRHGDRSEAVLHPDAGNPRLTMTPIGASGAWNEMISRPDLNFVTGTYVISFDILADTNAGGQDIRICIGSSCWNSYATTGAYSHQRWSLAASAGDEFSVWAKNGGVYQMKNLIVQKVGTVFDFDSVDQRAAWVGRTDNDTGLFWPDGVGATSSSANFAGVVTRDPTYALGSDVSLRTRNSGMQPLHNYRICYSVRDSVRDPQTNPGWLQIRVVDNTTSALVLQRWTAVPIGSGWVSVCTSDFAFGSSDAEIELGIWQTGAGSILVDNLYVEER